MSFKVEAEVENEKAKKEKNAKREKRTKKSASRSKSDETMKGWEETVADENKDRKDGKEKRRKEKKAASEAILELLGDKLKSQEKNVKTSSALAGKVVGLYFGAKWNAPCRTFTTKLAKTYQEVTDAGKPFEIVFISSDREEAAFNSFHDAQPWLALPYADRERKDMLVKHFDTDNAIPSLVIIDAVGEIIEKDGKQVDFMDIAFPWTPSFLSKKQNEANDAAEADRAEAKAVAEEAEQEGDAEAEEDAEAAEGEGEEAEEAEGGDEDGEGDLGAGAETF